MNTEVKRFYALIKDNGSMNITKAASEMKVSEEVIEKWAQALEEKKMLSISYPLNPLSCPIINSTEKKKAAKKKIKKGKVKKRVKPITKHSWGK